MYNVEKMILAAALTLLVGACAAPQATCPVGAACPAKVVAGFFPGTFRVAPDVIMVPHDATVPVIWSVEDKDATFTVVGNPASDDGIEFLTFEGGTRRDVTPCFPTNDGKTPADGVGRMYRCTSWQSAHRVTVKYKLRFHDRNGVQRTVDPAVSNTGDGFVFTVLQAQTLVPWRAPATPRASSCDSTASCPPLQLSNSADPGGASLDPNDLAVSASGQDVLLTWAVPVADTGAYFDYLSEPRDGIDWPSYITLCWLTDKADGEYVDPPSPKGKYLRCKVPAGAGKFSLKYQAAFHGGDGTQRTASGTVSRP